jgi:hypothetical protein
VQHLLRDILLSLPLELGFGKKEIHEQWDIEKSGKWGLDLMFCSVQEFWGLTLR